MHLVLTHPLLPGGVPRGAKNRVALTLASVSGSLQAAAENASGGRRVHRTSGNAGLLQAERLPGGGGHQRAHSTPDIRAPQRYNKSLPSSCQGRRPRLHTNIHKRPCGGSCRQGAGPAVAAAGARTPLDGRPPRGCAKEGAVHMRGQLACLPEMQGSCTVLRTAGGFGCRRSARPAVAATGARTPRWMGDLPGTRPPGRPPRSRPRALDAARAGASAPNRLFVMHLSMGQKAWQTQEATKTQGLFAIKALFLSLYPP